ncbi:hypothetical protein BDK51DRAFT_49436 [Blyttiomyces helicus]|uniref:PH domain-containing protein n=1 Tax=Blyttiomyces helicus TaxID=388810 RepID=A0A4P9W779_9FUNG|nr:hypothetical protein BDK51DRAFT_49436 [Blyttiomyces helicus]|eukprot:RKO88311.1 hypothetical protein BDK51DRAFT_49436 [Blyttiomyces helicus]
MLAWFGRGAAAPEAQDPEAVHNPVFHLVTTALKIENAAGFATSEDADPNDDRSSIHEVFVSTPHDPDRRRRRRNRPISPAAASSSAPDDPDGLSSVDSDDEDPAEWTLPREELAERGDLTVEEKIQVAFELPQAEEYLGEFACWLVRSVLLKGYIFITKGHICFYASLPKDEGAVQKAGFLRKRGSVGRKLLNSYWFVLKDDMLTFFENSTNLYYPLGGLNLKDAIEIRPSNTRENGFKILTAKKKFHLQADTPTAMAEWIRLIKSSMFRARNGEDVRIVLPLKNVTDLELNKTTPLTQSLRIRVDDEDMISEEYYFSYFNDVTKAYEVLRSLWDPLRQNRLSRPQALADGSSLSVTSLPPKPSSPPKNPTGPLTYLATTPPPSGPTKSNSLPRPTANPFALPSLTRTPGPTTPLRLLTHRRSKSDAVAKPRTDDPSSPTTTPSDTPRPSFSSIGSDGDVGSIAPPAPPRSRRSWGWGHRKTSSEGGDQTASFAAAQALYQRQKMEEFWSGG